MFEEVVRMVQPKLPPFDDDLARSVAALLATGSLTKGRHLRDFEERVAEYVGTKHAVAVSSCTLGLMLSYQGLGLRGEVIIPSFTFMATIHPLAWVGVRPVFVDIDTRSWCIDPKAVENAITERTSAIVGVHVFGNPCRVDALQDVATRHGITLLFDSAHAFGSRYRGRPAGAFGIGEVFSLSPTKPLIAGEGGVVTTDDDGLAEHVRLGREYGSDGAQQSLFPGLNGRLAEFNAILGLRSLDILEASTMERLAAVDCFKELLHDVPGLSFQLVDPDDRSSHKDLSIVVDPNLFGVDRDALATALAAEHIETRKYFDPPMHNHKPYRGNGTSPQALPVTMQVARNVLTLPLWTGMPVPTIERICSAIADIHRFARQVTAHVRGS